MKVISNRFLFSIVLVLYWIVAHAESPTEPPEPTSTTMSEIPPPPPGLPIDENIIILMIIALLFGIYIIYNHRLKTKASI